MAVAYSTETCRALEEAFAAAEVLRPMRMLRYEPGAVLTYELTGVAPAHARRSACWWRDSWAGASPGRCIACRSSRSKAKQSTASSSAATTR